METSSDLKQSYRSVYTLVKQLDDEKKNATTINKLFHNDLEQGRASLIQQCTTLLLHDHDTIGKKSREILWRKGYYDFIAIIKKNWRKDEKTVNQEGREKIQKLLVEGFSVYKQIAIAVEQFYELDLQYLVDFSILRNVNDENYKLSVGDNMFQLNGYKANDRSLEAINYALETIHSTLLSLGDLNRYFIEFNFDKPLITRNEAAKYYFEAFKLNPTIGMAHNQLGTLFSGQNFDLDSIYHYFYSLICTVPFELSENNVCKLLLNHVDYLETLDPDKVEFSLRDFFARFFLIIDIFFFDKEVPDFNSVCHCVLIDLRKVLCAKNINIKESSIFKIVSILLFCMSKLKMINSQKVYSLNAFLVAVCSDLIDSCIVNLEQFILTKQKQNSEFQETYLSKFNNFEAIVRKSRDDYKSFYDKGVSYNRVLTNGCSNGSGALTKSIDSDKSQKLSIDIKNGIYNKTDFTKSSDEAKESDLKTPMSSSKAKRRNIKMRRRRKRACESDDSSFYDSESDFDSDASYSNNEDADLSSNFDSDFSDDDDDNANDENNEHGNNNKNVNKNHQSVEIVFPFSDQKKVIDEERMIYPCDSDESPIIETFAEFHINKPLNFKTDIESDDESKDKSKQIITNSHSSTSQHSSNVNSLHMVDRIHNGESLINGEPPVKLKYKNKYSKIDPNIVIEFAQSEITMRSLKTLFDWLRINHEILFGCYHTNPEFIHKIMKLLNYCNIDIFTRKVYFERCLITSPEIREELCQMFDTRSTIPLAEDFVLKNFDLLRNTQTGLDWETQLRDKITPNEESILRIFKMVDFGFFVCKMKKFNYKFCAKSRRFTENTKKKREKKKPSRRERRARNNRRRNINNNNIDSGCAGGGCDGSANDVKSTRRYTERKYNSSRKSYTSNEEKDTVEENNMPAPAPVTRRGYLRNRINKQQNQERNTPRTGSSGADDEKFSDVPVRISNKNELMGKLWLKNEVQTLESKIKKKPIDVDLTPYVVVDAKSLTEHMSIVRNLVKTKKFVVLIPNAVLSELDELKKHSDRARNVIRWFEQEFVKGNRHLRTQRVNENLTLSLLKIPKKLDREATHFLQIAQFCNYIVTNHSDGNDCSSDVLTYLFGDNLYEKKVTNFSYTGILDAIPVRYDQILNFYSKCKKK